MGAYRDAKTFALGNARTRGNQTGRAEELVSVASDLGVDPDTLDGLGHELSLPARVERLSLVAESVGVLLRDSREQLAALQDEDPAIVAGFVLSDQLPALDQNHRYSYFGTCSVYRLQVNEGGVVEIMTDVWGGAMMGPYNFRDVMPLSPAWVADRLVARGVERDEVFCERVVAEIAAQMTGEKDLDV